MWLHGDTSELYTHRVHPHPGETHVLVIRSSRHTEAHYSPLMSRAPGSLVPAIVESTALPPTALFGLPALRKLCLDFCLDIPSIRVKQGDDLRSPARTRDVLGFESDLVNWVHACSSVMIFNSDRL